MSEGYSEEEALKKAIDEFGKDLPDMRDGRSNVVQSPLQRHSIFAL